MHIDKNALDKFQNNEMETKDMIAFLEHLDNCDYCLDQMINRESQDPPAAAPVYLKEQILARTASMDVKAEKSVAETSYKMKLLYEGLHTAVGVLVALLLLFSISQAEFSSFGARQTAVIEQTEQTERPGTTNHLKDFSIGISEGLSNGSDKISDYLSNLSKKIANGGF